MDSAGTPWRLDGATARLTCGPLAARLNLANPSFGLSDVTWHDQPTGFNLLMIVPADAQQHASRSLVDSYVRQNDLVATYERTHRLTAAPQIYWRILTEAAPGTIGIEAIVSMQTDLLDSTPASAVMSSLPNVKPLVAHELDARSFREPTGPPAAGSERDRLHLYVLRSEQLGVSYAQCVHPDDYVLVEFQPETAGRNRSTLRSLLFDERLEKGVIRRARICGWFLPAENDLAALVELARRFIDEPLPLTA